MRISVTYVSWLLPLLALLPLMQGCDQKTQQAQNQTLAPPIVDTPPPKASTVSTADLPPPVVGPTTPSQAGTSDSTAKTGPQKKPARPKKAPLAASTPPPQPAQEATNSAPTPVPSVSAIGELSGGASGDLHSQTEDIINTTEKGVNAITRTLSDSETKTAAQIHEFLKQAREALSTGDVDGALTLAKKAKVLLEELNQ